MNNTSLFTHVATYLTYLLGLFHRGKNAIANTAISFTSAQHIPSIFLVTSFSLLMHTELGISQNHVSSQCDLEYHAQTDFGIAYRFQECTAQNWAITKHVSNPSDAGSYCVSVDPTHRLYFRTWGDSILFGFINLTSDDFIVSPEDETAVVSVLIDGTVVYSGTRQKIGISDTPPLRYSFDQEMPHEPDRAERQHFSRGNEVIVRIAEAQWKISLRGSHKAIEQLFVCDLDL